MLKIGHTAVDGISGHEAGRRLLVQMYRQETGHAPPDIVLLPRGKPHFVGDPLYFSISHTPRHVFCALSDRPIGIDAEELDRPIKARPCREDPLPGGIPPLLPVQRSPSGIAALLGAEGSVGQVRRPGAAGLPQPYRFSSG